MPISFHRAVSRLAKRLSLRAKNSTTLSLPAADDSLCQTLLVMRQHFLPLARPGSPGIATLRELGLNACALPLLRQDLETILEVGLADEWITLSTTLAELYMLLNRLIRTGPA